MKKIVSLLLSLVLIIAMAVPAMALTSTMKYKDDTGMVGNFAYETTTGASVSRASASLTYDKNANLYAQVVAETYNTVLGTTGDSVSANDFVSDLSVSVAISAGSGRQITEARGYYRIGATSLPTITVK